MPAASRLIAALLALALLTGCVRAAPPARPLSVAAAASVQFAFTELGRRFQAETGRPVVFTFGASGNLAQQIRSGAPLDLFVSADERTVEDLIAGGHLVRETRRVYATGHPVLALSRQSTGQVTGLADLADPQIKRVAIANPAHAPYGMAARQVLLAAGLWQPLEPKLVYAQNVGQALQFVETGNAEAGIVALATARVSGVSYLPIDAQLYTPLRQALAVVAGTPNQEAAQQFIDFLISPPGQAVMAEYGFSQPGGQQP